MKIDLITVDQTNEFRLCEMFHNYVLEMQKYLDQTIEKNRSITSESILARYWKERPNWPYLIMVDDKIAGFCLLRRYPGEPETIDIDQYYVVDDFRREGVGGKALEKLFEMHPGNWLIRVLKTNTGALAFWLRAVENCIGKSYTCRNEKEEMHFFRFSTTNA